jgi:excisionase family DNA binding protein
MKNQTEVTMKNYQDVERLSYGVREAAAAIGISSRTMHDHVKNGSIKHFRMGTRVLIPAGELKAFIARRTQADKPQPSPLNREEAQS